MHIFALGTSLSFLPSRAPASTINFNIYLFRNLIIQVSSSISDMRLTHHIHFSSKYIIVTDMSPGHYRRLTANMEHFSSSYSSIIHDHNTEILVISRAQIKISIYHYLIIIK